MQPMLQPEPEPELTIVRGTGSRIGSVLEDRQRTRRGSGRQGGAPPLFGQPLHRLARARDGRVPTAIAHVLRTIHARLERKPGITPTDAAALMDRDSSEPGLVRLQMELDARDDADLGQFSVAQLFLALDLWLGMLPSAVVSGAPAEEFLGVWRRHEDASAAILAARTLSPERRAILHAVLRLLRRVCADSAPSSGGARGYQQPGAACVSLIAPSLIGLGSLDTAEAERLVWLWLDSEDQLDAVGPAAQCASDSGAGYVPAYSVHLNFFLDPNSASGPVHCGRVAVAQGVTQLGSAWAKAHGWAQPSILGAKQYQLVTDLEHGSVTLKVLSDDPPTRYRGVKWSRAMVLARDMVQEIQGGDSLSFPGGRFVFEVNGTVQETVLEGDGLGQQAAAEAVGATSSAKQPVDDESLQQLRTDILNEFEGASRGSSRGSTVGGEERGVFAHVTSVAPVVAASPADDKDSRELQEELSRIRGDLARERQLREQLERRLRTTEKAMARERHQAYSGTRTSSDGKELAELRVALAAYQARQEADAQQLFELQQLLKQKDAQVTDTKKLLMVEKQRLWAESDVRRKLHNDLQEIKGNIRVLARIRPIESYSPKKRSNSQVNCRVVESDSLVNNQITIYNGSRKSDQTFDFDACFSNDATNADVFDEVSAAITSVLDGYNVSMLAYGQTGSGKTYTMHGTEDDRGVIFRAVWLLFDKIARRQADGCSCNVTTSLVEVYNDNVYDLMAPPVKVGMVEQREKLELRSSKSGRKFTVDMQSAPVTSSDEAWARLDEGLATRAVGVTNVNAHSSRSHLVFTVNLEQQDDSKHGHRQQTVSKLVLVDLAGSERVAKSEATGLQLVEAQHINRSLSALGDVIAAIRAKQPHIPYRNSKLTALLADALGDNAKAFLFAHVAPLADNTSESLSTLTFAKRASEVTLGKPTRRVIKSSSRESKQELQAAKDAAEEWRAEAQQAQGQLAIVESALAASEAQVLMLQQQMRDTKPVTPRVLSVASPTSATQQISPSRNSTLGGGISIAGDSMVPRVSASSLLGLEIDFASNAGPDIGGKAETASSSSTDLTSVSPGSSHPRSNTASKRYSRSGSPSGRGSPRRRPPPQAHELAIGDRLEISSSWQAGTVAYVGRTHLGSGDWVGLVMDDCVGKHNGSIGDRRYFDCKEGHGMLLKLSQVRRL